MTSNFVTKKVFEIYQEKPHPWNVHLTRLYGDLHVGLYKLYFCQASGNYRPCKEGSNAFLPVAAWKVLVRNIKDIDQAVDEELNRMR